MTAQALGNRIRETRQRAGSSRQALAERVGLGRTAVDRIEAGARRISALEPSDVARALKVRMGSFLEDPVPAVVARRSSQGLDAATAAERSV